ncbi:MAG: uL15 family ribosomal protein [archaeon]|nr:uL15 family ribosomal protein [archaeon]
MVVRTRKKKNKVRGERTHGGGGTKNRRGAGSRGGRGRAGSHKHKYSLYYKTFGIKQTLKPKVHASSVNVSHISDNFEKWVAQGKAKRDGDVTIIDGKKLGFAKVLGRGTIDKKIKLVNCLASAGAATKIVEAGGDAGTEAAESFEAEAEDEEVEE